MSESDSDSTDSYNNNVSPLFNHYLRLPRVPRFGSPPEIEIDNSSDSEMNPQFNYLVTSDSSDVWLLILENLFGFI